MLYKFEMGHNITEATKNICCPKGEGVVDDCPVTIFFKKFHSGYKNLNDKAWSGRPKTMDFEATFQARKSNLVLFTNPSARVGYDTRSIFKRSLTGLNSEFSFS